MILKAGLYALNECKHECILKYTKTLQVYKEKENESITRAIDSLWGYFQHDEVVKCTIAYVQVHYLVWQAMKWLDG